LLSITHTDTRSFLGGLAYRVGGALAAVTPPHIAYCMSDLCAISHYGIDTPLRRAVRSNLRHVLGAHASERTVRRAGRAVYVNFGRAVVDFLRLPSLSVQDLAAQTRVEGAEAI